MIKYMLNPTKILKVKPKVMDRITANTEPRTLKIPFTPYIHGIYFSRVFCFNNCIPVGKRIPSKKPNGNSKTIQAIARITDRYARNSLRMNGWITNRSVPEITIKPEICFKRFTASCEYIFPPKKLPAPIPTSREPSKIDKAIVGEPR